MTTNHHFNFPLFRNITRILRCSIFWCDALMTLHCAMLLHGSAIWFTEYVAGFSLLGFIVLYMASYLLNFCWRYRACLIHDFVTYSCIIYQREFGFGESLTFFRIAMTITGVVLLLSILIPYLLNVFTIQHSRPVSD